MSDGLESARPPSRSPFMSDKEREAYLALNPNVANAMRRIKAGWNKPNPHNVAYTPVDSPAPAYPILNDQDAERVLTDAGYTIRRNDNGRFSLYDPQGHHLAADKFRAEVVQFGYVQHMKGLTDGK